MCFVMQSMWQKDCESVCKEKIAHVSLLIIMSTNRHVLSKQISATSCAYTAANLVCTLYKHRQVYIPICDIKYREPMRIPY